MNNPSCYGRYSSGGGNCSGCIFALSCKYYEDTASAVCSLKKCIPSERNNKNCRTVKSSSKRKRDSGNVPVSDTGDTVSLLSIFFRYLLELDEYTLGLITQLIAPVSGERCSAENLRMLRGCSRQAIHRKMLAVIAMHPELSSLFVSAMGKLSSGRKRFLRSKYIGA